MNQGDLYILKGKIVLSLSAIFIIASICLVYAQNISLQPKVLTLTYETINTQAMATAKVAVKKPKADNIFTSIVSNKSKFESVTQPSNTKEKEPEKPTKPAWRLPTEQGYITQYERYGHTSLDITSSRGTNERIYPVADGVITSIFYDNYGAKIVTINHYIDGKYYSSQYVHLSWYAPDIYVGKKVTTDDCLGGMGATGYATGIHLHLTVLDCNLYDASDSNCSHINAYYDYGRRRFNQGFYGLRSLMNVPHSWYSR